MSKCECKECLHYGVCLYKPCVGECPLYKSKSLFVELPCKFGEKIYVVPSRTHVPQPLETKLLSIGIDDDGDIVYNPNEYPKGVFGVSGGILGKTVFLTKEEAEKKLKEVQK